MLLNDTLPDRFWNKVRKTDTCWLWTAGCNGAGYPKFQEILGGVSGAHQYAHRLVYTAFKGSIPNGLEIDHLCRVRHCVNPDHLEAVDHRTNILRGNTPMSHNARKTHCKNGHPFDLINTHMSPIGKRSCRTCRTAYGKVWRAAHV